MLSATIDDMGPDVYTVSDITANIKHLLEQNFPFVWINGEISNFTSPLSGHYYFALKDDKAQIAAVMFKGQHRRLEFRPEDGMSIRALGRLTVYEPRGAYQLIVEHMLPVGAGALYVAFEQLKKALLKEGLFDDQWKKPLPQLPSIIKLVTSPTGAALHDVVHVINRRFPAMKIKHFPVQVQGEIAAGEIVSAIANADQNKAAEVIIIARGGGSFEDLAPFNSETVARAIFACKTPVVTGIGHQTDFSIADHVADYCAPTPSAAAEIVVPLKENLQRDVAVLTNALQTAVLSIIYRYRAELGQHIKNLAHPRAQLQHKRLEIDHLSNRLTRSFVNNLQTKFEKTTSIVNKLKSNKLNRYIIIHRHKLEEKQTAIVHNFSRYFEQQKSAFLLLLARLKSADPTCVLKRGFSITRIVSTDAVVTEASSVSVGQKIKVTLSKGTLMAEVIETTNKSDRHSF